MKILIKPVGLTSNEFITINKQKNILDKKACYCGRLDPMARGKMLILEGDECKKMPLYLNNNKTYEFEIITGISTDTDDCLGIFNNTQLDLSSVNHFSKSNLCSAINKLSKLNIQKFHRYSSYVLKINDTRKPLWEWEKLNLLDESNIPEKKVKIHNIEFLDEKFYTKNYLINTIIKNISRIDDRHNFRQNIIKKQWQKLLNSNKKLYFRSFKFKFTVSSGFYIRQLIYDLKRLISFPLFVYDINRIEI